MLSASPSPALLAILLVGCSPAVPPPELGRTRQAIVNGTREPTVVELTEGQKLAIGWLHEPGDPSSNYCTATLIAPTIVATASHCTTFKLPNELAFGIGLLPTDPDASFIGAGKFEHPDVDAALIILGEDVKDRVPGVEPIAANLVELERDIIGREVEGAGYGATNDPGRFGRYFAAVTLTGFDETELSVDGEGERGLCFGDSGGPVLSVDEAGQPVVLGVESWGDSSCVDVDHLTRLDVIADWIGTILAGETPADQCDGLDYEGSCEGDVAVWCDGGRLARRDCRQGDFICAWVDDETGYYCTEPPPCDGVSVNGVCDGDVVQRCRREALVSEDCAETGQVCATDTSGAFCAAPDDPEPIRTDSSPVIPPVDAGVDEPDLPSDGDPDAGGNEPGGTEDGGGDGTESGGGGGCRSAPLPGAFALPLFSVLVLSRRRRCGAT